MPQKTGCGYAFGPFVLDTARRLLLRNGSPISLTPKSYDTLLILVENSGRMLTKDEMMRALWPDSFVEEANLTQQISVIRKALADDGSTKDRYIVTIPGRGYRFAEAVREAVPESAPAESSQQPKIDAQPAKRSRRTWKLAFACMGLAAAALAFLVYYRLSTAHAQPPQSLAILPFQNLRQDEANDFLGFSLADAIITRLASVNSLTVRPSYAVEKYRKQKIDIPAVAEELHVDTVLTGSFVRDGDALRITAQLVRPATQQILWNREFDLKYDKLLTVQDKVAQQIISGLALTISPREGESLKPERPVDPLAYEFYLRGVDLYARSEFPIAIRMLEKSAELDPNYALTWAHLGRSYTANASFQFGGRSQYRLAQAAYEKALALDPAQIETQIYMANFFTDTGRVEQAVPLLRQALRTNANQAEAHWELGYAYRFAGMLEESAAECVRARRLDPSVKLTSSALNAWLYLGQYDRFLGSLPMASNAFILFYRGFAEYYKKDRARAAEDFDRAYAADPSLFQARVGKALASGIRHENQIGLELLHDVEQTIDQRGVGDPEAIYKIAQAYAVLGDKSSALRVLKHSVENGFFPYRYLSDDPLMATLRKDAEFVRLITIARQRYEGFRRSFF